MHTPLPFLRLPIELSPSAETLTVQFDPVATGTATGQMTITSNTFPAAKR
jgi:hypothetical protein